MVFFLEVLDARNNSRCPLDDQVLKSVTLVEVGVHKLLHRFTRQFVVFALLVKLGFLLVNIVYQVS